MPINVATMVKPASHPDLASNLIRMADSPQLSNTPEG